MLAVEADLYDVFVQVSPSGHSYMVSVNFVKFGPHWLSVFLGATLYYAFSFGGIIESGHGILTKYVCLMQYIIIV